jgi:hypothetical protein
MSKSKTKKMRLKSHVIAVLLITTCFGSSIAQQWTGSTSTSNTIYRSAAIKVGYGPLYLDWTYENNWNGNANNWAGYIGFNAFRGNNDPKDYYYGDNIYTNKAVFEGSGIGFRWLYRTTPTGAADAGGQHLLPELMRITPSGDVGIGTTSPDYKLTVNGGIRSYLNISGDDLNVRSSRTFSSEIQGLRVDASTTNSSKVSYGLLGVASSTNTSQYYGAIGVYGEATSPSGGLAGLFVGDMAHTGNIYQASDQNLKQNIQPLSNSLDVILKLRPKQYEYKNSDKYNFPIGKQVGFLAQDVREVLPHLVREKGIPLPDSESGFNEDNNSSEPERYLTMDYVSLIPYIIKSIQDQYQIIEDQGKLINVLMSENSKAAPSYLTNEVPYIAKVFPNPASSILQVEIFTKDQLATILIFNKDAKIYQSILAKSSTLDIMLDKFENGIYIISLSVNGTTFDTKRFIVSK